MAENIDDDGDEVLAAGDYSYSYQVLFVPQPLLFSFFSIEIYYNFSIIYNLF